MKRRGFLQTLGLVCAGGATVSGAEKTSKKVLITSAECDLAPVLSAQLRREHDVHLTGSVDIQRGDPFSRSALGHDESTTALVREVDTIVHVAEPPPGSSDAQKIGYRTRCTYNLLQAATAEGVRRVVYLSSLTTMLGYDDDFEVTEVWRPLATSDPDVLSHHLGEFTCREFAHERRLEVVVLRLGKVVREDAVKGKPFDPLWVEERDVAQAVSLAVHAELKEPGRPLWNVLHIQSASPRSRFTNRAANGVLGYKPQFRLGG